MSDVAIRVENLSKLYRIGGKQARYNTLRDSLSDAVSAPFRRISSVLRGESTNHRHETIWALKDVSFEVKKGEVVGIIGKNGAGKSTLLKVLSRITEPTHGTVDLYGRVGSLLEVGTGFHPELTGRENIFLNGAILGMKKAEINRKFDEIVDFSGVEKFIDTPVKHYSSGMYVRLAFAVAAHLEPEILLVDEVLAVGDAAFQKKCLGKMGEVAEEGRTVLFVSHNLEAIDNLCSTAIWLDNGYIENKSSPRECIDSYLTVEDREVVKVIDENHKLAAQITQIQIGGDNRNDPSFLTSEPIKISLNYEIRKELIDIYLLVRVQTITGFNVFTTTDLDINGRTDEYHKRKPGKYVTSVEIPNNFLMPGSYTFVAAIYKPGYVVDRIPDAIRFSVIANTSNEKIGDWAVQRGVVIQTIPWCTQNITR